MAEIAIVGPDPLREKYPLLGKERTTDQHLGFLNVEVEWIYSREAHPAPTVTIGCRNIAALHTRLAQVLSGNAKPHS
jgi:hypothetical protein